MTANRVQYQVPYPGGTIPGTVQYGGTSTYQEVPLLVPGTIIPYIPYHTVTSRQAATVLREFNNQQVEIQQ